MRAAQQGGVLQLLQPQKETDTFQAGVQVSEAQLHEALGTDGRRELPFVLTLATASSHAPSNTTQQRSTLLTSIHSTHSTLEKH